MQKVVAGVLYDSDKAECVYLWEIDYERSIVVSGMTTEKSLYLSLKGRWFVCKERVEIIDGVATWYRDLTPLTPEEARIWLEEQNSDRATQALLAHFPLEAA